MSLAALALTGCGDEEPGSTTYSAPTATPTPTSTATPAVTRTATATPASPEDQPGGAGDEEPIVWEVELTVGSEGFEPPQERVPAFFQVRLTVRNETAREQTVTVDGAEPFTVPAGGAGHAELGTLPVGRHRVALAGTPFEATLIAEKGSRW